MICYLSLTRLVHTSWKAEHIGAKPAIQLRQCSAKTDNLQNAAVGSHVSSHGAGQGR